MEFYCPTKILSGLNALDGLKTWKASKVLVVTDSYFSQSGKAMEVAGLIPNAQIRVFDQVQPDPPAELAAKGAAVCNEFQPDLLLALGGGSALDCAKGIRLAASVSMTFAAIPTTAGSGSEVTSFSILTHKGVKQVVVDPLVRPDVAVLDGKLLSELPKSLIADTGMDLLAHCIEAIAATNHNGFTDALAIRGAALAFENLLLSWQGNKAVRGKLLEAATMAGMAFDNSGLGLCHAVAHVLGGAFHLPHGRLCAMILPKVMAYNASAATDQYARLAVGCGMTGATRSLLLRALQRELLQLQKAMVMPGSLQQAGIEPAQVQQQEGELVRAVLADPCCNTNPVPVTEESVRQILKAVTG